MDQPTVTLTGAIAGRYVIDEQRPDGSLVLRPDLSVDAILARHGEQRLAPDDFEREFGELPTDDDG